MQEINKINKIQKLCVINAILHQYKIKYFKGTNFRGIDFLVLLREIFVQVLIFMYFTPKVTVTGIFLINAISSVKWHFLGVYYRGRSKETGRLLEELLRHMQYDF